MNPPESSPTDETTVAGSRRALGVPLGLVFGWLLWNVAASQILTITFSDVLILSWDFLIKFALLKGPPIGQVALIAIWGVWGPGGWVHRGLVAVGLFVALLLSVIENGNVDSTLFHFGSALVGAMLVLGAARYVMGWRLRRTGALEQTSACSQFRVRYLFGLTTAVAILAGLAKANVSFDESFGDLGDLKNAHWHPGGWIGLLLILLQTQILMLTRTLIFSLVQQTRRNLLIVIPLSMGLALVVDVSAYLFYSWSEIQLTGSNEACQFVVAELGLATGPYFVSLATVALSALALRWAGYTIVRKGNA